MENNPADHKNIKFDLPTSDRSMADHWQTTGMPLTDQWSATDRAW